ncbi:MAG: cell division FtsA domain-containing protein [Vulcanimicrobiota bacterium]
MRTIGGIDPGTSETREVFIQAAWKSVKVVDSTKSAILIGSVPSQLLTYRKFTLPFVDKKKIRPVIKEELAESLVFPVTESTWDFSSASAGDVFVIIGKTQDIDERRKGFSKTLNSLDAEPYALLRTALYCGIKDALVIDLGSAKTVFCVIRDGFIDSVKVLIKGGEYLTGVIAETRKIDITEAEQLKRRKGMELNEVKAALIRILRAANIPSPFPWQKIVITGRGAQMEGLKEFLEENLKTTVSLFELPSGLSPYIHQVAFGLALKEKEPGHGVNLMEEKKVQESPVRLYATAILVPLLLISAVYVMQENNLKMEIDTYRTAMKNVLQKEFPGTKHVTAPLRQFESALAEKKSLSEKKSSDVLGVFETISTVVSGKDINIYEIDIGEDTITLTGETVSYSEVDNMKKNLLNSFSKVDLQEGKTLPSKRITFNLIITMKEKEGNV